MEWWLFLVIFFWWDEIISFIKKVYNDISSISTVEPKEDEFEDYDFEEYYLKEDDESDIEKPKNTIIESDPNVTPTVTRMRETQLGHTIIDRPTVINRKS